jgi:hypothetical protein
MNIILRYPDNKEVFFEDADIRESMEAYMAKADVWGVAYKGKLYRCKGGGFETYDDRVNFVIDMEEKK